MSKKQRDRLLNMAIDLFDIDTGMSNLLFREWEIADTQAE